MAPTEIVIGQPSLTLPTSVSSMYPSKIKSFMFATVAIVVPSLKVLLRITEFPTFTGMSRISPVMVERTSVELDLALLRDTPSLTTSRVSTAAFFSSFACWRAWLTWSNSSALTSCLSYRAFSRS